MTSGITVMVIPLRALYCNIPGPEVEVSGVAEGVVVRWKCRCGLFHEAKV
jgi:hypothetical protein